MWKGNFVPWMHTHIYFVVFTQYVRKLILTALKNYLEVVLNKNAV